MKNYLFTTQPATENTVVAKRRYPLNCYNRQGVTFNERGDFFIMTDNADEAAADVPLVTRGDSSIHVTGGLPGGYMGTPYESYNTPFYKKQKGRSIYIQNPRNLKGAGTRIHFIQAPEGYQGTVINWKRIKSELLPVFINGIKTTWTFSDGGSLPNSYSYQNNGTMGYSNPPDFTKLYEAIRKYLHPREPNINALLSILKSKYKSPEIDIASAKALSDKYLSQSNMSVTHNPLNIRPPYIKYFNEDGSVNYPSFGRRPDDSL